MKKTVVILYTKGMYDTIAEDICNYMTKRYPDCDVVAIDEDRYSNLMSAQFVRGTYVFTARNMAWLNRLAVLIREQFLPKKIDKTVKPYEQKELKEENPTRNYRQKFHKVDNIFMRFTPEIVICLSPKAHNKAILAKQRLAMSDVKVYAMITDFSLNKAYINYQSDGYFVQNDAIKQALIANKVDEEKIRICGTVIDEERLVDVPKSVAREKIGIVNDLPTVAVIGGRYGVSYVKDTFATLAPYTDRLNLVVLTGGSATIEKFVLTYCKAKNYKQNIFVVKGKTDMNEIYAVSDVVVSSPTTVTMYEIFAKNIPCVLIRSLNNNERGNHTFLAEEQLAMRGGKDEQLATAVLGFINNNNIKQEYLYNQRKFFDADAIENFAKEVYRESCAINKEREDAAKSSVAGNEDGQEVIGENNVVNHAAKKSAMEKK